MSARFCSACGAELPGRPPVACVACGAEHWRDGKACANAIVERGDGSILLVRRNHDPWRGLWCAPGGFGEYLEPPEETARRETREEAGVDVHIDELLGIWVDVYADDPRDEAADWISVAYFAAHADGDGVLATDALEVSEARWFRPDAVPLELAPPGTLRDVLSVWRRKRSDGRSV